MERKVIIRQLNMQNRRPEGRARTVHVGKVRPTLEFEYMSRPHGEEWTPEDLWRNVKEDDTEPSINWVPHEHGTMRDY